MSSVFERITAIADVIIALALVALVGASLWFAWTMRRVRRTLERTIARVRGDLAPVLRQAEGIGEDLKQITAAIRSEVDAVTDTVSAANERVQRGIAEAETRLGEFNALLDVVQHEAESLFVSTASTVRGIRGGADAFRRRSGTDLASDELDPADPADDTELVEDGDGQHGSIESAAAEQRTPRVRPRGEWRPDPRPGARPRSHAQPRVEPE